MERSTVILLAIHIVLFAVIGLNVPLLREPIVFLYLIFVPGFVVVRLLGLKLSSVEIFLFSAGLSLTILMFLGLLINQSLSYFFSAPLSLASLTIGISLFTIGVFFIAQRNNTFEKNFWSLGINWSQEKSSVLKVVLLLFPPLLAIIGALYLNIVLLMILVAVLACFYVVAMVSKFFSSELYPLLIFSFGLALLFGVVFTSRYVIGYDINLEYFVYSFTNISGHWSFIPGGIFEQNTVKFASCLSITILPTFFSKLSSLNGTLLFKLLYPFVFALIPVILYQTYRKQVSGNTALASALFYISGSLVFYGSTPISIDRQIVGEFFLVISIFVWLTPDLNTRNKKILLIIFGAAMVVSHYSVMLIYLAIVTIIFLWSAIRKTPEPVMGGRLVLLFYIMTFTWFSLAYAPIINIADIFTVVSSNLFSDFYSTSSRVTGVALTQPVSIFWDSFTLAIFALVNIFVAIGLVKMILKPKGSEIYSKYKLIAIVSSIILVVCLAVPNLAPFLNLDRLYEITMLFLALFFAIGFDFAANLGKSLIQKVLGKKLSTEKFVRVTGILLCVIMVLFLLTQTGFVNRITESPPLLRSLDLDRMESSNDSQVASNYYGAYLTDQNVQGAIWLCSHLDKSETVLADFYSYDVLSSYGLLSFLKMTPLTNSSVVDPNEVVYLNPLNVKYNTIVAQSGTSLTIPDNSSLFERNSIIYSNGQVEILYPNQLH